ncbi:IS256 family transposase, partial [Caloramator proteoclasticus]
MSLLTKEQLKAFINQNNIQFVNDLYASLKELFKETLQEMLEAELSSSLGYEKYEKTDKNNSNSRNGYTQKTVKTQFGEMEIDIPRDRNGEFEPQIVPKYKRDISGIEEKVIALYARGMSTRDIHDQIKEIYGIDVSAEMVSKITERIVPEIKSWQSRPLEKIYPFVFMDAIHYKVRTDGHIINRAAYVVLGVTVEGNKEILGIWIGENESSRFWLGVLNELKNRGVEDVLIFSVDGLAGIKEAIQAAFPNSEIQRCVIHQLRNCFKYVSYKHLKEFSKDFKAVYQAPNEEIAREEFEKLKSKWQGQYPYAIKSW